MTLQHAIIIVEDYNKWRRGDYTNQMPDPKELGVAIEMILEAAKKQLGNE